GPRDWYSAPSSVAILPSLSATQRRDAQFNASPALLREELKSLLDELLVELEDSGVAGVGLDHQLVVRETAGHVEGVRRRQHPVVIAVREEHGMCDLREVVRRLLAPAAAGLELREVRADGGRRVAVDRALLQSSQECLAFTLAVRGPGEERGTASSTARRREGRIARATRRPQ